MYNGKEIKIMARMVSPVNIKLGRKLQRLTLKANLMGI